MGQRRLAKTRPVTGWTPTSSEDRVPTKACAMIAVVVAVLSLGVGLWLNTIATVACGPALLIGCWLGWGLFWSDGARHLARFGWWASLLMIVCDVSENLIVAATTGSFNRLPDPALLNPTFSTAGLSTPLALLVVTLSTVKYSLLLVAGGIATVGIALTAARLLRRGAATKERVETAMVMPEFVLPSRAAKTPGALTPDNPSTQPPTAQFSVRQARWASGYFVPDIDPAADRKHGRDIGFGLSGGGIRSASVTLGVLDELREDLIGAGYLVSVSGGGYTSGALIQMLTDAGDSTLPDDVEALHDPQCAFRPGTVEYEHLRRNCSYLSDTPAETLTALGVVGRGFLASVSLLFAPAILLGAAASWYFRVTGLASLPEAPTLGEPIDVPVAIGGLTAVLATAGAALLVWGGQILVHRSTEAGPSWPVRLSAFLSQVALVVAAVNFLLPLLGWLSSVVLAWTDANPALGLGGPASLLLLTYGVGVAAMVVRKVAPVLTTGSARALSVRLRALLPAGLVTSALVTMVLAMLALLWVMLFGFVLLTTPAILPTSWHLMIIVLGLYILVVGGLLDQTSLSLHPFYRRRLASAFAVRAARADDGAPVASPLSPREATTLSTYGRSSVQPFPEVVFSCAASLSGERYSTGRQRSVSFTMTSEWVGGPEIGWMKTAEMEKLSPSRLTQDLTVQAAVALSGAAFASSMGRMTRWYQSIFAITGARLGAWLPNPRYFASLRNSVPGDWTMPRLPAVRRLGYLLREIFGVHPLDDRLIHVTDGGHYENLGLVELLRRRCSTIYLVDASGDSPPTAKTLATAIRLAYTELGVRIELDQPFDTEAGAAEGLCPPGPFETLNRRLSRTPVITGTVHYPEASGLPEGHRVDRLFVARSVLWPGAGYDLLSYAVDHQQFPNDNTSDQWFDEGQFTAYTCLGQRLGSQLRIARDNSVIDLDADPPALNGNSRLAPRVGHSSAARKLVSPSLLEVDVRRRLAEAVREIRQPSKAEHQPDRAENEGV